MSIRLSLNGYDLHSFDKNYKAIVTNETNLVVEFITLDDISAAVMVWKQNGISHISDIVDKESFVSGSELRNGTIDISVVNGDTITDSVTINIVKLIPVDDLVDDDPYLTIDEHKRMFVVPSTQNILAVSGDTNSEVITFRFPRFADGVDLSEKEIFVNYELPNKDRNKAICSLQDTTEDTVEFTWIVSEFATRFNGKVRFNAEFWSEDYRWQTQIAEMDVATTVLFDSEPKPDEPEFLDQYLTKFNELVAECRNMIEHGVDPEIISQQIAKYLSEHPIKVDETDPTVPNWAKAATKPSYTASEISGAVQIEGTSAANNIPIFSKTGKLADSRISADSIATMNYVNTKVSSAIAVVDDIADDIGDIIGNIKEML